MSLRRDIFLSCVFLPSFFFGTRSHDDALPYDSNPRIEVQDGHLMFLTAKDKNITLKTNGIQGRVNVDGEDLGAFLDMAKVTKAGLHEVQQALQGASGIGRSIRLLTDRLDAVENATNSFSS
ncbi:unnamed protein product, partial [Darwinula stevensoni]